MNNQASRGERPYSKNWRNAGEAIVQKKPGKHTRTQSNLTTQIFSVIRAVHPPTQVAQRLLAVQPPQPIPEPSLVQSFVKTVLPAWSLVFRIACGFTNAPSSLPDPGRK